MARRRRPSPPPVFDQDARQQAADTTEAVQHNVGAFTGRGVLLANHIGHLFTHELLGGTAGAFFAEFVGQLAQVYRGRAELELAHGFEQWECFVDGEFAVVGGTVTRKAVGFENRDDGLVDQAAAIDRAHHIVIAVQLTDKRDHRFCECFTVDPFTKTLVGLLSHGNLPHVGAEKRGYIMPPDRPRSNARPTTKPLAKNTAALQPSKYAGSRRPLIGDADQLVRNPPKQSRISALHIESKHAIVCLSHYISYKP